MKLVGVDEAGRGPLAGPVMTAVVYLTDEQAKILLDLGLRDSKKMTALQRKKVYCEMVKRQVIWRTRAASSARIDRMNILQATLWAMGEAVKRLPFVPDGVLVDGNKEIPNLGLLQQTVVGGDNLYPAISAASVIAKVCRDRIMESYDKRYPQYGFAQHKGYGTAAHRAAIAQFGPCPLHRRSFSWGKR